MSKLYIENSETDDLGVFAGEDIKAGEVLETVPFLVIPRDFDIGCQLTKSLEDSGDINPETLYLKNLRRNLGLKDIQKYFFKWSPQVSDLGKNHIQYSVLPLGYGCIYNSSNSDNNARWDVEDKFFKFYAIKDIKLGDEIKTFYGYFMSETGQDYGIKSAYNIALEQINGKPKFAGLRFENAAAQAAGMNSIGSSEVIGCKNVLSIVDIFRTETELPSEAQEKKKNAQSLVGCNSIDYVYQLLKKAYDQKLRIGLTLSDQNGAMVTLVRNC